MRALLIALSLFAAVLSRGGVMVLDWVGTAAPASYTLVQAGSSFSQAGMPIGDSSSRTYGAGDAAITASTFTCTKIGLSLGRVGTGVPLLTGYIWADNAGAPGTLLATSTNTVDGSTLVTTGSDAEFLFSGVTLTNGVTYWFGASANVIDASNYNIVRGGASSTGSQYRSNNGTTWTNSGVTRHISVALYTSP